ncbi:unnamed protein product [Phaedon cochleariae]|uniref:RRM domain-containing protein n=1 Tax=Phaedon cochleariae TaxID=80249 RepID=A0A9P0D9K6_PHACE|nr:unnamed protein product [Phaedon cochleariae]
MTSELLGFKVLPLQFSSDSTSSHDIFLKEHSIRKKDENKPPGQTLFVINIPPIATEDSLKTAFSPAGKITRVILDVSEEGLANKDGFRRAFIVFSKRESLLKALRLKQLDPLSTTEKPVKTGIKKWMEEYNSSIVDIEKLQEQVDDCMRKFESEENNKKEDTVDDEGWTLVTKGGRKSGLSRKESVKTKLDEKIAKSSKNKELKNFYTFQIRESKMENIAKLRKNFEEAKKKVNLMKEARKFKPY